MYTRAGGLIQTYTAQSTLTSCLKVAFILLALSVFLVLAETGLFPIQFCHFLFFVLGAGDLLRPLTLSAYSVVVLSQWRSRTKTGRIRCYIHSGLSIAIPRLIALVTRVVYIVPSVTTVQYLEGVVCYPDTAASSIEVHSKTVFTVLDINVKDSKHSLRVAFGNVAPLLVSTQIPAYCLHYIKKHSISENLDTIRLSRGWLSSS